MAHPEGTTNPISNFFPWTGLKINDHLFFGGSSGYSHMIRTNLDLSGVVDIIPGNGALNGSMAFLDNKIITSLGPSPSDQDLYIGNGITFSLLKDINPSGSSGPRSFTQLGTRVFLFGRRWSARLRTVDDRRNSRRYIHAKGYQQG